MTTLRKSRVFAVVVATLGVAAAILRATTGPDPAERRGVTPVVLVHGIFGTGADMGDIEKYLRGRGVQVIEAVSLTPNDGSASIVDLSRQLDGAVEALRARAGGGRVDVVGYSMGALVSRHWIQRNGGKDRARRYVSLAGPHHGVPGGYLSGKQGAHEMRPRSELLNDLDADPDPWGAVEVFDFYTPFDAIILPASTAKLKGARATRRILAPDHHGMAHDPRALQAVASALLEGAAPPGDE